MNSKYQIKIWDKLNLFFLLMSILLFIPFIAFFIYSFINKNNGFASAMAGIFGSLFSAFFIAVIVRVVDMKKQYDNELKAFLIVKPYLLDLITEINQFLPHIGCFTTIKDGQITLI